MGGSDGGLTFFNPLRRRLRGWRDGGHPRMMWMFVLPSWDRGIKSKGALREREREAMGRWGDGGWCMPNSSSPRRRPPHAPRRRRCPRRKTGSGLAACRDQSQLLGPFKLQSKATPPPPKPPLLDGKIASDFDFHLLYGASILSPLYPYRGKMFSIIKAINNKKKFLLFN